MKLSSCRELKQTVLGRAYRASEEMLSRRSYRVRKARTRRRSEVQTVEAAPVAAIGVAPGKGKDYKLAVRIFKGCEKHEAALMRGLGKHEGEIDLAVGVRYKKRLTLRAGGSCGHYKITAGTLGGFVEDDDNYYMMSNNHVFANSNFAFGGDRILSPGPIDITGSFDVIGNLERWSLLSKEATDGVDVAVARFSDDVDFFRPWSYTGIGTIKKAHVTNRFSVTRVIKRGRTTGVRRGTVSAFELDGVQIDYGTPTDPAIVTFNDQIEVIGSPPRRDFSAGGDSGSFIIDRDTMKVYALLYGGGPDNNGIDRTLAHFIPEVFGAMNVRLVQ